MANRFQGLQKKPNRFSGPATPQTVSPGKADRELSMGETAMDMLKSAGTGVVEGAVSLGTMGQDLGNWLGGKAAYGALRVMGRDPQQAQQNVDQLSAVRTERGLQAPGNQQVMGKIESATGPLHQPETTAGEYAKTVGEFVPGAMIGPGGLARKAATAIVPGIASEAAGQATEGEWYEPYARMGGALAGGVASAGSGRGPIKQMVKNAPSVQAVQSQKNTLYKALENAGVKYDANAYGQWASTLEQQLMKEGLDPTLHPQATAVLKRVLDDVGNSPDFVKMETLRKVAGEATRGSATASAADINRAGVILREIDNFFGGAPLISNGSIPANQVQSTAQKARELARRNIVAREIQEMDRKSQFYVSGSESGQRNQFANYLRSSKGKGLTPAETGAFNKVVRREGVENVLHNTGSRLAQIGTMGAGVLSMPATGALGPLVSGAAILGNIGARKVMEKVTDKRVRDALATVLAGKTAQTGALSASKSAKQDALIRALLATDSGRRSAQPPFLTDAMGREYPYPAKSGTDR